MNVDPTYEGLLTAIRVLLLTMASALAMNGLDGTTTYHVIMIVAGSVVAVGSAVWQIYASVIKLMHTRAVGVQAGINLTVAGDALDTTGRPIPIYSPVIQTKPVTLQSASDIVRNYGTRRS